jgi:hypothetical protein
MSKIYTPDKMKEIGEKALPKGQVLYPPQIINRFMKEQGANPKQIEDFIIKTAVAAKQDKAKIIQLGNTVFIITPKPDHSAEFVTTTVEPDMLPMRVAMLANTLRHMKFRKMSTIVMSDYAAKVADDSGLNFKKVQTQVKQGDKTSPAVRYEMAL